MSLFNVQFNPSEVLGVAEDAPLHDLREAFRLKAKRYHPDVGGEEWAFRVLVQSYEILSQARVARAAQAEAEAPSRRAQPRPYQAEADAGPRRAQTRWHARATTEKVRAGAEDKHVDPTRIVDVEKLWIRFEVEHIWILQEAAGGSHDDRFLSCSLNVAWPDAALAAQAATIPHAERTLKALGEVIDEVGAKTQAISFRGKVEDHKFAGWLSYPNVDRAWEGFKQLREALHACGLGVKQWTRDLIIPRDWRDPAAS